MSTLNQNFPTVVELNNSQQEKKIFCFHTFGGGIHFYEGLAGLINDVARVYGLEEPYIYDDFEYCSFPELASYHVETIKSIQPHGPYLFFGYCSGGPLAYEVAAQLELEGEEIEAVVMFGSEVVDGFDSSKKEQFHFLKDIFKSKWGYSAEHIDWDALESMSIEQACNEFITELKVLESESVEGEEVWIKKCLHALVIMRNATKRYIPPKSKFNVDLYRKNYVNFELIKTLPRWCNFDVVTAGRVRRFDAPQQVESYVDIMFDPYIDDLARKVREYSLSVA